jgi:hypothetical protein
MKSLKNRNHYYFWKVKLCKKNITKYKKQKSPNNVTINVYQSHEHKLNY